MTTSASNVRQTVTLRNDFGQPFKTFGQLINPGDDKILGDFDKEYLRIQIEDADSGADLCIQDIHLRNKEKHLIAVKDAEGRLHLKNAEDEGGDVKEDDRGLVLAQGLNPDETNTPNETESGETTCEACASNPEGRQLEESYKAATIEDDDVQGSSKEAHAPAGSYSTVVSEGSEGSIEITIMNVASRRVLVNGMMCEVGELTSIGKFVPSMKHKLTVMDELGKEELMTQEVLIQSKPKHLVVLDKVGGELAIRKQGRSGMPYDGDIDTEEENDFVAANEDVPKSANNESGVAGVTQEFQQEVLQQSNQAGEQPSLSGDANKAAWQDPQATTHATASGQNGPSLTAEIEEPQTHEAKKGDESRGRKRQQDQGLASQDEQSSLSSMATQASQSQSSMKEELPKGLQRHEEEGPDETGQGEQSGSLFQVGADLSGANMQEKPLDADKQQQTATSVEVGEKQMNESTSAPSDETSSEQTQSTNVEQTLDIPAVPTTVISVPILAQDSTPVEETNQVKAAETKPSTQVLVPLSTSSIITESVEQLVGAGQAAAESVSSMGSSATENVQQAASSTGSAVIQAASTVLSAATLPIRAANSVLHTIVETAKEGLGGRSETEPEVAEGDQVTSDTVMKDTSDEIVAEEQQGLTARELATETAAGVRDAAVEGAAVARGSLEVAKEGAQNAAATGAEAYNVAKEKVASGTAAVEKRVAEGVDSASTGLSNASEAVRDTATETVSAGKDLAAQTYDAAKHNITSGVAALETTAESASDAARRTASAAADKASSAMDTAKGAAANGVEILKEKAQATSEAASSAYDNTKDAANAGMEKAREVASATADATANAAETAKDAATTGLSMARGAASNAAESAKEAAETTAEAASNAAEKVREGVVTTGQVVGNVVRAAGEGAMNTASLVGQVGSNVASSAYEGAKEGAELTAEAASSAALKAKEVQATASEMASDAAARASDMASAAKVKGVEAAEKASEVASTVADNAKSAASSAASMAQDAASRASETASSATERAKLSAESAASKAMEVGSSAKQMVADTASSVSSASVAGADAAVRTAGEVASSTASSASNLASRTADNASNLASGAADTATDAVRYGVASVQSGVSAVQDTSAQGVDSFSQNPPPATFETARDVSETFPPSEMEDSKTTYERGVEAVDSAAKSAEDMAANAAERGRATASAASEAAEAIVEGTKDTATDIANAAASKASSAYESLKSTAGSAYAKVQEGVQATKDKLTPDIPTPYDIEEPSLVMDETTPQEAQTTVTVPGATKVKVEVKADPKSNVTTDVVDVEEKEDPLQT